MPDHIEKCRNLYYATLKVPVELQAKLGRTKFKQTLGTAHKGKARDLAKPIVAMWKAELRQADGEPQAVQSEALRWRAALRAEREAGRPNSVDAMEAMITTKADDIEAREGEGAAVEFAHVALGYRTPSVLHFDDWKASITALAQKTQDQAAKDVRLLVDHFACLEDITPDSVARWVGELSSKGTSPASVKRLMSFWRSFWAYLRSIQAVPRNSQPFQAPEGVAKRAAKGAGRGWAPFPAADVPKLITAAVAADDGPLVDLITLGAYTGARIEELCALRWADVHEVDHFRITDAKTAAGVREVPIHSALVPLVQRLKDTATDEYVLPGLTFNKYGDRSNAIGKRFGRLKASIGYGPQHVFHSLRKTLVTKLEDAGVGENLAADIVGHEKPRITYGLYSGGASLATKREALEKVRYPM